ncbi:hypothetical protein KCN56_01215 [Photobacterium galatheae]|uniref:hypothetical protein n=1 Tax=Photobacterium galatheae TaxID=1654360 RepID=UPI00202CE84C|nr:hypothetical protein [Photobacterium galatheae]MCM0147187.1 hypothetical protein [Photobacterium galatheae]
MNSDKEIALGRMAFWLDPKDIEFLANEWRKIPDEAPEQVRETWARIAFRAHSALYHAGIKIDPQFPEAHEQYQIYSSQQDSH